jgi:hypothetical protein
MVEPIAIDYCHHCLGLEMTDSHSVLVRSCRYGARYGPDLQRFAKIMAAAAFFDRIRKL